MSKQRQKANGQRCRAISVRANCTFDGILTFLRPDWAYAAIGRVQSGSSIVSKEVDGFDSLAELALNLRWSWNHASDEVWRQLDSELWELTHNPWVVLQTVSRDKIKQLLADPVFRKNVDGVLEARRQGMAEPAWFQKNSSQYFP